jgi:hypothetical protein
MLAYNEFANKKTNDQFKLEVPEKRPFFNHIYTNLHIKRLHIIRAACTQKRLISVYYTVALKMQPFCAKKRSKATRLFFGTEEVFTCTSYTILVN